MVEIKHKDSREIDGFNCPKLSRQHFSKMFRFLFVSLFVLPIFIGIPKALEPLPLSTPKTF